MILPARSHPKVAFLLLGLAAACIPVVLAVEPPPPEPAKLSPVEPIARPARPVVTRDAKHDLSAPLRTVAPKPPRQFSSRLAANRRLPNRLPREEGAALPGPAPSRLAPYAPTAAMPALLASFEGVTNRNDKVPPDTNADVGASHVMQWVNTSFAIWDKSGTLLYGPADANTVWSGFGGLCETNNNGDPVVLYDQVAGRWIVSQLAFTWPGDFHQCIAVSETEDPTGSWYRYDFPWSPTTLNDYPKFGVWPDGYYMAVNQFDGTTQAWRGQAVAAFERERMLLGQPARVVRFDLYAVNSSFGGQLPSHLVGPAPPPAGAPNVFVEVDDRSYGFPTDRLSFWRFHVDWSDTSLSTFGAGGNPDSAIDLEAAGLAFDPDLCGYASTCIPQPSGNRVDALSDRLMYRLAYRNFGSHEALLLNHTVDVDGTDHAGVRWYEVRDPAGTPYVQQAGTHAPDAAHRWMGSFSMDGQGGAALGYSVSSPAVHPSVRYAGRLASDPPGSLPQAEATLAAGAGSQTGAARWGDYSSLSVDPTDDCTFWYTQEYYAADSPRSWQTRIGAFRFDGCRSCPILGAPSLAVDREPPGVRISWETSAFASGYDVAEGDLGALRSGGGDFSAAATACLADNHSATSLHVDEVDPAAGEGFFYLVRAEKGVCRGTFDEAGGTQSGFRDAQIAICP